MDFETIWSSNVSYYLVGPHAQLTPPDELKEIAGNGVLWFATSGSTGQGPKWVAQTRQKLETSARAVNEHLKVLQGDRWLLCLPLYHVGGLGVMVRSQLSQGVVFELQRWAPYEFLEAVRKHQIQWTSLVPTQVFDLVQMSRGQNLPIEGIESLKAIVVGGGALSEGLFYEAKEQGWPILTSYGMTEMGSQIATSSVDLISNNTMSLINEVQLLNDALALKVLSHVEVKTQDGVLWLKSNALFKGYLEFDFGTWHWRPIQLDAQGWWKSSDLVSLKEVNKGEWFLTPLGRVTDQYKVLGELIHLGELERQIQDWAHQCGCFTPLVLIARKDRRRGVGLDLVAEMVDDQFLVQVHDLKEQWNQRAPSFARIQNLYWVDEIPRSSLKKVLREPLIQFLGLSSLLS